MADNRERWLTAGAEVTDLIGPESVDQFHIQTYQKGARGKLAVGDHREVKTHDEALQRPPPGPFVPVAPDAEPTA